MERRQFLASAGTAVAAGLAGCSSLGNGDDQADVEYTVTMDPVGEVGLPAVPEDITVYMPGYADMLVALGHGDAIASVGQKSRFHTGSYEELDGVSVDKSSMTDLVESGVNRETFMEIDGDLHLIDPNWLTNVFEMNGEDISFLEERVAPFLGNTIFRRTDAWHDYDYYTLYGAFEKVAEVVREQERYEAFESFHDDFVDRVATDVPDEGPRGALVWGGSDQPTEFSPYHLSGQGANKKSFHDLNVRDAIANSDVEALSESQRSKIDYETLLDLDPEALFVRGHEAKTREEFENTVLSFMRDHETASRITAVENGDVYRGGPIYLGPIQHLFLTERFATALYSESFSGELFDRAELADVITS